MVLADRAIRCQQAPISCCAQCANGKERPAVGLVPLTLDLARADRADFLAAQGHREAAARDAGQGRDSPIELVHDLGRIPVQAQQRGAVRDKDIDAVGGDILGLRQGPALCDVIEQAIGFERSVEDGDRDRRVATTQKLVSPLCDCAHHFGLPQRVSY
ncbi:hypothetical protein FQZ97_958380 [compost metagenome]